MTDNDHMVDIAHGEFEEFVGEYRASVCESKQRMVCEDGAKTHGTCMKNAFMAKAAETCMPVHDLYVFSDEDVAKDGKAGEDSWKCCLSENDKKRDMVDLQAIREIMDAGATFVRVRDNDDFVTTVDQLG